jgi:hypothetical protein
MHKTAKTADLARNEAPEAAQLRDRIAQIVQHEFGGDLCSGIWLDAARRATDRIMTAIGPPLVRGSVYRRT